MSIDKTIRVLESKVTELNLSIDTYTKTNDLLRKEKDSLLMLEKLKDLIIDIGQRSQHDVINYLESSVTMALQGIFGNDYKFKIEFETKRDQTECKFLIEKDGLLLEPRNDSMGHGITDVVSFATQILNLILEKAPPILIMDEPQFKNISKAHLNDFAEMVHELATTLKIQLIMVSHIPEMIAIADNTIEFK